MATVNQLAGMLDVSPQTIRTWTGEFADYLSPQATPQPGDPRIYNESDVGVLALVADMRQQKQSYEVIHRALASGDRGALPEGPVETTQANALQIVNDLTAQLARAGGMLEAVQEALTHTRADLDQERVARLAAEIRATRAETMLGMLQPARTPPESTETGRETPATGRDAGLAPVPETGMGDTLVTSQAPPAPDPGRDRDMPEPDQTQPGSWRQRLARWVAGKG